MIGMSELWHRGAANDWALALERYWDFVKPENVALEHTMDRLDLATIRELDPTGWYEFLRDRYFRWKYTQRNRYATTTALLRRHENTEGLAELYAVRERLLSLNTDDITGALVAARGIHGLGIAGASGLLALMYPTAFGTVDQFAVKALRCVQGLPEAEHLRNMNPEDLSVGHGVILIRIMRQRAAENNRRFESCDWTPRMIDKVLWGYGRIDDNDSGMREAKGGRISGAGRDRRLRHGDMGKANGRVTMSGATQTYPEKMQSVFGKGNGEEVTREEIISAVLSRYPGSKAGSIIPTDYCYNMINKDPASFRVHLFEAMDSGRFRCLGLNYPYTGKVSWKERAVGEWVGGRCRLNEDPRRR